MYVYIYKQGLEGMFEIRFYESISGFRESRTSREERREQGEKSLAGERREKSELKISVSVGFSSKHFVVPHHLFIFDTFIMFICRKNLVFSMLCMSSLLICCQLYPMRGSPSETYGSYGMSLAKRDPSMSLKDSLLSALYMNNHQRGGTPSQRKKAVDSTFIRFGRSSMPEGGNRTPNLSLDEDGPQDIDYMNSAKSSYPEPSTMENMVDKKSSDSNKLPSSYPAVIHQNGCVIRNKSELYMVLMGKTCVRASPKVKRENVNDTFIRFGKRHAPSYSSNEEVSGSDIKYGR